MTAPRSTPHTHPSSPAPATSSPAPYSHLRHTGHQLGQFLATWWPALAVVLAAVLVGLWWIGARRADNRYRHGPGMASSAAVLGTAGRSALARAARFTRPGLARRDRGKTFAAVGARIGKVGTYRRRWFGFSHEDSVGVLSPQRQGKTRRLLARFIIDSPGTTVFASTKPDLLTLTAAHLQGRLVHVLDPDAALPSSAAEWTDPAGQRQQVLPIRWSPVAGCEDPAVAIRRAKAFVGDDAGSDTTNAKFFVGAAAQVLRCFLHGAAIAGRDLATVVGWAGDPRNPEPVKILETHPAAAGGWAGQLRQQLAESKSRDDVFRQLSIALEIFADPAVLARACPTPVEQFDLDAFLRSGQALFILASEAAVNSSAYTTTFVTELVTRAQALALTFPASRWEPPVTITLDELTQIARIPEFPRLLADSGGRGISFRWAAHGRTYLEAVWGAHGAASILNNSTWKVVLQGIDDAAFLTDLQRLAGDVDELRSGQQVVRSVPVMPASTIYTQQAMTATVWYTGLPPFRAQLVDISKDRPSKDTPHAPTWEPPAQLPAPAPVGQEGRTW